MKRVWKAFPYLLIFALSLFLISKPIRHIQQGAKEKRIQRVFPVSHEVPFVVIIPSYNNSQWCEKNLRSVLEQAYKNYRVIYIDDCSTDDTSEKTARLLNLFDKQKRVTVLHNEKRLGAMENIYQAIHSCDDREVAVLLDGDDWLTHDHVLEILNTYYADPNVWVTYGSSIYYPSYTREEGAKRIPSKVFKRRALRKHMQEGFSLSHLQTFYVRLFKKIRLQDFLMEGNFLSFSCDQAIMLPLVEMAGRRARFVNEVLYVNNRANPLTEDKINLQAQTACRHYIWSLSPYRTLRELPKGRPAEAKADIVVFSYDRPLQLYAFLESLKAHTSHCGEVSIIYRASSERYVEAYEEVEKAFPKFIFLKQLETPHEDFKYFVLKAVFETPSKHVVFALDDSIVKDSIDFNACIEALQNTGAMGFYLPMGHQVHYSYTLNFEQGVPASLLIGDHVYAWQFSNGKGEWRSPRPLDMVVFRKSDIKPMLEEFAYSHPHDLENIWMQNIPSNAVGLFYSESKTVNIPLNIVHASSHRNLKSFSSEELLSLFNEGFKIDTRSLFKMQNISAQIDCEPPFIKREEESLQ